MQAPSAAATTRLLRVGVDVLTVLLALLATVQSRANPTGLAVVLAFVVVYAAGRSVVRPADRPVTALRGRWWPDGVWVAVLAGLWVLLLVLAGVAAIWLAFPLALVQMHVLGPRRGPVVVVLTTLTAVAAGLAAGLDTLGAVLGPVLGAGVAVGAVLGLEAVVRESEERQRLIDELVSTRQRLAEAERARGVADERERLGREIHDTLAQGLSSIELLLRVAQETGDDSQVGHARRVARENLAEVRSFVRGLGPVDLAGSSLEEALGRVVERHGAHRSRWTVTGEPRELPVATAAALVRIAQSALANVDQHASAHRVDVTLSYLEDAVVLDLVDDGVGFDPEAGSGFGLDVIRERAREVGGRAVVESGPGRGTAVAVEVPG